MNSSQKARMSTSHPFRHSHLKTETKTSGGFLGEFFGEARTTRVGEKKTVLIGSGTAYTRAAGTPAATNERTCHVDGTQTSSALRRQRAAS